MAIEPSMHVYMTSFGMVALPENLVAQLNAVPKRKDRQFDRRFRAGKQAWRWGQRVNEIAGKIWADGGEMQSSDVPEIEEAGASEETPASV